MTETNSNPTPATQPAVTQTPPVIFLDFEGVLVFPDGQWSVEAMHELNRLCLETGGGLVLTTSCRYSAFVKALRKALLENGLDKAVTVLGETRDLDAYRKPESRVGWASIHARRALW
ncbi:hypothetical protein B1R32_12427 [Abditibacterium utsteinense]|uniref:Haloacid dehalogenase-like hydrolase n=1 Tax=Abditibacterium utsteinense TaxID=1960156 RepID=A0A2S8SPJ7_9BACT|nr:hypothetical protein [Abditibacterium utsteinense]PQV62711.1 hypothetical protein B1R32_12427 [Abditibacterium utsteinense]